MAEIRSLSLRIDTEGARRLLAALEDSIASGGDLGPRGPQMRVIGHSLEQASLELRREVEGLQIGPPTEDANLSEARTTVIAWRDEMLNLADAFTRLARIAQKYPD